MSYQTHGLAEWAQFLSLGIGFTATGWLLWLLLFEPLLGCDLDPRPAMARATRAVHQAAVEAGRDVNRAIAASQRHATAARNRARLTVAAALLALALRLNAPNGVSR